MHLGVGGRGGSRMGAQEAVLDTAGGPAAERPGEPGRGGTGSAARYTGAVPASGQSRNAVPRAAARAPRHSTAAIALPVAMPPAATTGAASRAAEMSCSSAMSPTASSGASLVPPRCPPASYPCTTSRSAPAAAARRASSRLVTVTQTSDAPGAQARDDGLIRDTERERHHVRGFIGQLPELGVPVVIVVPCLAQPRAGAGHVGLDFRRELAHPRDVPGGPGNEQVHAERPAGELRQSGGAGRPARAADR